MVAELSLVFIRPFDYRITLRFAVGSRPLDIKWFRDDVQIPRYSDYITRYNEATGECVLEIPEVFAEDAGVFMIQAINEAGIGKCYCNLKVCCYLIADSRNWPSERSARGLLVN